MVLDKLLDLICEMSFERKLLIRKIQDLELELREHLIKL